MSKLPAPWPRLDGDTVAISVKEEGMGRCQTGQGYPNGEMHKRPSAMFFSVDSSGCGVKQINSHSSLLTVWAFFITAFCFEHSLDIKQPKGRERERAWKHYTAIKRDKRVTYDNASVSFHTLPLTAWYILVSACDHCLFPYTHLLCFDGSKMPPVQEQCWCRQLVSTHHHHHINKGYQDLSEWYNNFLVT